MESFLTPVFIVGITFLSIVAIVASVVLSRHRERTMMIQKGLSPEEIKAIYADERSPANPLRPLKWGLVLIGIGIAVIIGLWLEAAYDVEGGIYPALIALFGGIALVVFHLIARKRIPTA